MNESAESRTQERQLQPQRWLLLAHHLPPKPDYLRVKLRRRLQRIGAVALRNAVYVLPEGEDTREDFEWLVREIEADGGEATLCCATLLAGSTDESLKAAFRAAADAEYAEIEQEARLGGPAERLQRRMEAVVRHDFFNAAGRGPAEAALQGRTPEVGRVPEGAVWVTRAGVFIDRIGSAWLIRRFIDPAAQFKFVAESGYAAAAGELRFDMFAGEYSHEGDRCTFETLLSRFELTDPALGAIGEIVHDIDLKDDRFGRKETAGIESVVRGIALEARSDVERVERGALVFDGLYARLRSESQSTADARPSSTTPSAR
jgi:hypothetical protein